MIAIGALGALMIVVRLKNGPPVGTAVLIAMPIVPIVALLGDKYRRLRASILRNGLDAAAEPEGVERKIFAVGIVTVALVISLFGASLLAGTLS